MAASNALSNRAVRKLRQRVAIYFSLTFLLITAVVFFALFDYMQRISLDRSCEQLRSESAQVINSLNVYINKVKTDCNDVFASDAFGLYDPVTGSYSSTDDRMLKASQQDRLLAMSAGRIYNDYFILYSNGTAAGKISQGAADILEKEGYAPFDKQLADSTDCWIHSPETSVRKIFYLRRVNDHALFVISFYAEELDEIYPDMHYSKRPKFLLADSEGRVITSNDPGLSPGDAVPAIYTELFSSEDAEESVIGSDRIATAVTADRCGWRSYGLMDCNDYKPGFPVIISFVTITAAVITAVCVLTSFLAFSGASGPPDAEFIDPLTGSLNEYGLDEKISELLETSLVGSTYAFMLIGIKDADQIKRSVSIKYWDDIRKKLVTESDSYFADKKHYTGRMYQDYALVFADYSEFDLFKAHDSLEKGVKEFCKVLAGFTAGEENELKLNVSIGVCIYPDHGDDFDILLDRAETAYREAESREGDSYCIYKPGEASDKEGKI